VKSDREQNEDVRLARWLRAVCDEPADPTEPAELREARDLVDELRAALRPEPLPRNLVRVIELRVREHGGRSPRLMWLVAPLSVAAAAVLAVLVMARFDVERPRPSTENTLVALSADDAEDIVSANALLSWEGQLQTAMDEIAAELDSLQEATEPITQAGTNLPWAPEDDWDAVTTEGQSRAGVERRA
jgi:hypothetical protein